MPGATTCPLDAPLSPRRDAEAEAGGSVCPPFYFGLGWGFHYFLFTTRPGFACLGTRKCSVQGQVPT